MTVVAANGEVQTKEEATVYVKELDQFVTVMLLEDTPAVLSLGNLCEDHRYSWHWTTGQKPTTHQKRQTDRMQDGEQRTHRCPWSIDKLFNLIFTYFSYIFVAGNRDSHGASSINKKVRVCVKKYRENCRMDQQKPKTHIKMTTTRPYGVARCVICQNGYRSSATVW